MGRGSLVATGASCWRERSFRGLLVGGVPAKIRRELTDDERGNVRQNARNHPSLAGRALADGGGVGG